MSSSRPPPSQHQTLRLGDSNDIAQHVAEAVRKKSRPALVVMSGGNVGTRVTVNGNVLIGRDPKADLVLPDPGVSFQHALIEDQGGTWVIVDLKSTNGTSVDGQKVESAEIRNGTKIGLGTTLVRLEIQDEADEKFTRVVEHLIHKDDLTGLYLRRRFDAELSTLLTAAARDRTPVGFLAMDLDGIKRINDTLGHLFGAYTIAETGKLIGRLIDGRGIACRFGGDEFLAAFPGCSLDRTAEIGTEILNAVGAHPYSHEGVALRPGISIGVAAFPEMPTEADTTVLFRTADEALYRAKGAGKNRVCRCDASARPET